MWETLKLFWHNYFRFREGRKFADAKLDWRMAKAGQKRVAGHDQRGRLFQATNLNSRTTMISPGGEKVNAPVGVRLSVRPRRVYRKDLEKWVIPGTDEEHEDQSASGPLPRGRTRG